MCDRDVPRSPAKWLLTTVAVHHNAGRLGKQQEKKIMKRPSLVTLAIGLSFGLTSTFAYAESNKCGGADIANGPFAYTALGITNTTFNGTGGSAVSTSFSVRAPSPDPDTDPEDEASVASVLQ